MTVRFRDAGPNEAEAIAAIGASTFVETFGHLYAEADMAAFLRDHHAPGPIAALLGKSGAACRLVEDERGIAGYAVLAPNALPHVPANVRALEIKRFYLLARLHGAGAADPLMEWCEARGRAAAHDALTLSVFSENRRAQAFYRRHGFKHLGDYHFMVGNQADREHVWWKPL